MSVDLFTDPALAPSRRGHDDFAGGPLTGAQYGGSTTFVPRDPEMQRLVDTMNAERDAEKVREEAEMDTPENRQKAFEAEVAERKERKYNFHISRALPSNVMEGWKLIGADRPDEEIRVYTRTYDWKHRFWGIKPIGMTMDEFWEQHDPEVTRVHDAQQEFPVDPERPLGPLIGEPIKDPPPPTGNAAKPRRRQKSPEVNPTHRVRKSSAESSKVDKMTRKSVVDRGGAGDSGLQDQVREVPVAAPTNGRPIRNKTAAIVSDAEQKPATEDGVSVPTKRPRGRPAAKTKSAANESKRPRGRPPAKEKPAEKQQKQEKTPTVKDARVTKSRQTKTRPSAPSTHKMRTRGEGPAEPLRLS